MWKKKSPLKKSPRTAVSLRVEELGGRIVPTVSIIDPNLVSCDFSQSSSSGQTDGSAPDVTTQDITTPDATSSDQSNDDKSTTETTVADPTSEGTETTDIQPICFNFLNKETDLSSSTDDPTLADGSNGESSSDSGVEGSEDPAVDLPVDENGNPILSPIMYCMGGIAPQDGTDGKPDPVDPASTDIRPYYRTLSGEGELPVQDPLLDGNSKDTGSTDPVVLADTQDPAESDPSVDPTNDIHVINYSLPPGESEPPQEGDVQDPNVIFQTFGGVGSPVSIYQGTGQGTYTVNPGVPDLGKEYSFQGTVTIPGLGDGTVEGAIRSLGFIRIGQARGILTFTNAKGSVTVSLLGPEQAGFSALPDEFEYRVVSGTGEFLGANGKGSFKLTLDETNNQWTAALSPNQLTGSGSGTYTIPIQTFVIADAGTQYQVQGTVDLAGLGQTTFSGTFNSLGFVIKGNATGTLDLTNSQGTVSLSLKGPEQKGFSQLPDEFQYTVENATGEFASINQGGKFILTLNPDGTLACTFGENTPAKWAGGNSVDQLGLKVDTFYRTYLNREADTQGRAHWVSLLKNGVSSQEVVKDFLLSQEYLSQQGASKEAFIKSLYSDVLGRDASDSEVALWLANWNKGLDRHGVLEHILNSDESYHRALNNFYQNYLNREADQAGFNSWFKGLKSGQVDLDEVAMRFLNSPEYQSKNGPILID